MQTGVDGHGLYQSKSGYLCPLCSRGPQAGLSPNTTGGSSIDTSDNSNTILLSTAVKRCSLVRGRTSLELCARRRRSLVRASTTRPSSQCSSAVLGEALHFTANSSIVAITKSLHDTFTTVSYRNWNFYYHLHTSAVCFSTVVILRPTCFLAPFAMSELQTIVKLFQEDRKSVV